MTPVSRDSNTAVTWATHFLGFAKMLAETGIGLRELEIHLLETRRQRIVRLLQDGGGLIKIAKRASANRCWWCRLPA